MSKKKSKHARARHAVASASEVPQVPRLDWELVEAEFFARESELYQLSPVENFDDLDKD